MTLQKFASVTDIRKDATSVFKTADTGEDVFLLNHNQPKYVLLNFQRYTELIEELEDRADVKVIDEARKAKNPKMAWDKFKKRLSR